MGKKVFVLATYFARFQGIDILQTPRNLNDSLKEKLQMKMNSHSPLKHGYITQLLFITTESQIKARDRMWLDDEGHLWQLYKQVHILLVSLNAVPMT